MLLKQAMPLQNTALNTTSFLTSVFQEKIPLIISIKGIFLLCFERVWTHFLFSGFFEHDVPFAEEHQDTLYERPTP
jgi:hypothetical protein